MKKRYFIPASDNFDFLFSNYYFGDNLHIRESLNRRSKKIDSGELSYRILNHWDKNELIEADRGEDGTGWRKYSPMDFIWIQLIVELRKFGVSIENIKLIKEQLTETKDKTLAPTIFPMLELYTAFFLMTQRPVYVLIFDDFQTIVGGQNEIEAAIILGSIGNHIRISLHEIIQTVFKKKDLKLRTDSSTNLTSQEMQVILDLRMGVYKTITIKMKNGSIVKLEKEVESNARKLHEILKENKYDRITIEREGGKIVNITQTVKEKL